MSDNDNQVKETSEASAAENKPAVEGKAESVKETSQPQKAKPTTEEEAAWNKLSGPAQERFRQVIREKNELSDRQARLAQQDLRTVNQTNPPRRTNQDEVQQAIETLREGGLASKEDLDALYYRLETDRTHNSLEKDYDGSDGKPKYIKEEVEDYARRKGMGLNYLAAYRDMYFDELRDASRTRSKQQIVTEKPVATTGTNEPMTLERLQKELKGPNRDAVYNKYVKDPLMFNKLVEAAS